MGNKITKPKSDDLNQNFIDESKKFDLDKIDSEELFLKLTSIQLKSKLPPPPPPKRISSLIKCPV